MDLEFKRFFIEDGYFTEINYPLVIKPNSSILGTNIEITAERRTQLSFIHDDSIQSYLGFEPTVIQDEYKLSDNPVDNLSIDNIFLERDAAPGMII